MAAGKSRGSKRPSGGGASCNSSTATVLVFIFVCIFGVWMLTSNSIVSPQKKSIIMDSVFDNVHRKRNLPRKIPTHHHTVFEDNPGDLPADAIKSDDDFMAHDRELDRNYSKHEDNEPKETEHDHDHEITRNGFETLNDSDINHHGFQEKVRKKEQKPKTKDTQSFEGNKKPYKQHTENMITTKKKTENEADHQESNRKKQVTDANEGDEDQENRKRDEEHEKGPDEDTEIRSHSIANETKAQFENQEAKKETITTSKKDNTKTNEIRSFGMIPDESNEAKNEWLTQADQSTNHNSRSRDGGNNDGGGNTGGVTVKNDVGTSEYKWELCNVTAGNDYIPCLDNVKAINALRGSRDHFEHRQRLCPDEAPTCLVPLPDGYKTPLPWPQSRDKIWFNNVPHKGLAAVKGHQNWVKLTGEFLTFPGGGTQFIHVPEIEWGKHTRVILDVGCGVASFGGYLFDRNVLTMSFAPKDEHEAQVQFALERGIPAVSAVMGTQRLPFSSGVVRFFWSLIAFFGQEVISFGRQHPFTRSTKRMSRYGKVHIVRKSCLSTRNSEVS
ncbi:putative S-adenosyl-L-methionine-dependent methyltransferase [Cynara cardunculus var. scolymus]|uniref:Methyltransferase n=1 Tax=Cynara cardunculus var. scolymus TaxID=59895 RepID=A0A103Y5G5_CYNCS|nr:putative S-adenosyl-L-methionine-dependent methyltransferase [Cynara cardunculus var. scolymus]